MLVIMRGRLQSPALVVEGDALGALFLGDAEKLGNMGGSGGDERGLSTVTVLVSSPADLGDAAIIKLEAVQGKGKVGL